MSPQARMLRATATADATSAATQSTLAGGMGRRSDVGSTSGIIPVPAARGKGAPLPVPSGEHAADIGSQAPDGGGRRTEVGGPSTYLRGRKARSPPDAI